MLGGGQDVRLRSQDAMDTIRRLRQAVYTIEAHLPYPIDTLITFCFRNLAFHFAPRRAC